VVADLICTRRFRADRQTRTSQSHSHSYESHEQPVCAVNGCCKSQGAKVVLEASLHPYVMPNAQSKTLGRNNYLYSSLLAPVHSLAKDGKSRHWVAGTFSTATKVGWKRTRRLRLWEMWHGHEFRRLSSRSLRRIHRSLRSVRRSDINTRSWLDILAC
jgi:hypothetical protein